MFLLKRKENKQELSLKFDSPSANISGQVQVAADQLKGIVEQMKLAAVSLNQTSNSSKDRTENLMEHSERTVDYTLQVSDKMKMIESSAVKISSVSENIHESSQSSYKELLSSLTSLDNLHTKMDQLLDNHYTLINQMNTLVDHSQKINKIIDTIGEISKRTSILALNATIEAARSGEHGKGFAVVANEVGKLANQTSDAVKQTRENIQLIQNEISTTTNMVNEETVQVEEGSKDLNEILSILNSFKHGLHTITAMVADSTQAVGEQTSSVQEISALLDEISDMSIRNKDHVYQVTIDMDEQYKSSKVILDISEALSKTSNELQGIIKNDEDVPLLQVDANLINQTKAALTNLLNSGNLDSLEPTIHQYELKNFYDQHREIEAIWSNRLDGTFIFSNPPAGLVNAKARPWFIEAANGKTFISEVYTSALTKTSCVTLSTPIRQGEQIIGVLGVDLVIK